MTSSPEPMAANAEAGRSSCGFRPEEGPNEEQERFWNDVGGPLWVQLDAEMERHARPFGEAALAAAAPAEAERVLDVGCGCGSTTVALGDAVGPAGAVLGVDLSAVMLARARQRARDSGLRNVTFRRADAQRADLGNAAFDLVFSRFGVMFFADPTAAFGNLRRALRPGGRIAFVCWQPPSANPWMALPNRAAMRLFDLTPPPHDAPGPFSLAAPERVTALLDSAGFTSIDVRPDRRTVDFGVGVDADEWTHQRLLLGPARQPYLASDPDRQRRARRALTEAVAGYRVADRLRMDAAVWIVTARR